MTDSPDRETRWATIEALFAAAMDLPAEEREPFLETIADEDMRREVMSLIAFQDGDGSFIENAIGRVADEWAETTGAAASRSATVPGRRFGPYEVTGILGQGGMGAVYKARRADGQFEQDAAIKLVRHGFETPAALDRFRQERQILARLAHPAIARLLDGGTAIDESGTETPYLVMEFVEGESITAYCAHQALSLTDRVKLFRLVCDAVQYAHQQLIVHRDLKPTNILVTAVGQPKLLDFGIAKLLTEDAANLAARTSAGLQILTPEYASPEHVTGEPVTAAADVYSLGALLYELLTGEKAHKFRSLSPIEIGRVVCDTEPVKPSLAVPLLAPGGPRIRRQLEGDLDTIVLKALQKDPARRYRSVEQLSEDLRRHLEGLPVLARPDSWTYRTGKFVVRNRWSLAGAAVVAASLVAGSVVSVWQARRAERRFEQVRSLANSLIYDVHDEIRELPGSTKARQKIVATGLQYLRGLTGEAGGDPQLRRDIAAAYVRIGDVQGGVLASNLGDVQGALESYRTALALFEQDTSRDRARLMADVNVKIADALSYHGDMRGALATYERARAIIEPVAKAEGASPADREQLAVVFLSLARAHGVVRETVESLESSQRVLAIRRGLFESDPNNRLRIDDLADSESQVAMGLQQQGNVREALAHAQQSLALRERVVGDQPNNVQALRNLILSYSHVADALGNPTMPSLGDAAGAIEIYRKMTGVAERLVAVDHSDWRARWDLANCLYRLGNGLVASAAHENGLDQLAQAVTVLNDISATQPSNNRVRVLLAAVHRRMADALVETGRSKEAASRYSEAIRVADAVLALDASEASVIPTLAAAHTGRGLALAKTGQRDAALAEGRRGIDVVEHARATPTANPRTLVFAAQAYSAVGRIHLQFAKPEDRKQACSWLTKGLDAYKTAQQNGQIDAITASELASVSRDLTACR
jgi:eukaryotic-like serine/threonine-protein kinase